MSEQIVIVGAARTPMGSFQGDFSSLAAHDLGGAAIKAAVARSGVSGELVNEVLFGNCLMAGQGQAPARQAAFKGGLPISAGAVTLSKMCGSGMRAAMFGHDMLLAGSADVLVAGGMESMTNAPYLLQKARGGYRIGHDRMFDHMMLDGLEDAYEPGRSMGTFGEDCAGKYAFTREQQDAFATASGQRAQAATQSGAFAAESAPVAVNTRATRTAGFCKPPEGRHQRAMTEKPPTRAGTCAGPARKPSVMTKANPMLAKTSEAKCGAPARATCPVCHKSNPQSPCNARTAIHAAVIWVAA